ncbi:MAG: hypothetical protein FJ303_10615 [Planctomycetes bacterium]|nr:hypothetical protein [Planctomycetota bacterium]
MALAAVVMAWIAGCSQKPVTVSTALKGKITLDDQAVKIGIVRLISDEKTAEGSITPDGTYIVSNPPVGTCKIIIVPPPGLGMDSPFGKEGPPAPPAPKGAPDLPKKGPAFEIPAEMQEFLQTLEKMPAKYGHPDQSGLSTTIKEGEVNEYHIKMTTK